MPVMLISGGGAIWFALCHVSSKLAQVLLSGLPSSCLYACMLAAAQHLLRRPGGSAVRIEAAGHCHALSPALTLISSSASRVFCPGAAKQPAGWLALHAALFAVVLTWHAL